MLLNISTHKNVLDSEKLYDVLIIGTGPAGLSASIYAARKGLKVGVIGDKTGGQVGDTSSVENYIGFEFISGQDLAESFEKHAKSLGIDMLDHVKVKKVEKSDKISLICDNYMTYQAKSLIVATGSKSRQLEIPGEKELYGKGVTYCGICDGPLFKDKTVTVVGGGNSAVEAAIDLSKIANKVYLVHRSQFRADKILMDRLEKIENIKVHLGTRIKEIVGTNQVEKILLEGEIGEIKTDGVLVEIGYVPNSQFLDDITLNERGEVLIGELNQTNIEGIYAAGDVTNVRYKQIVVAASEGAKAALSVNDYINTL
ncbi:FAD-binding protein [Acidaminobacter sp. JC074]|uniref:NAD(P)/FAD-dependent oxidoreductase n=1 Tax=Acidaminobacter sp. JC074 TaxID=2530199 RepID=UPI001F10C965|nr:FAD-dependent oxidoreductase [Acidaminobacter sp. JC074]MCH4887667.1 FAD-binding protein [Acidaminobacter sp. JC074]